MVKQASSLAQLPDSLNRGFPNIFNKYVYNLAFFVKPQEMNQRVAVASNGSDVKSDHNAQREPEKGRSWEISGPAAAKKVNRDLFSVSI